MVTLEMVCCLVVNIEMLAFFVLLVVLFEMVLSLIDLSLSSGLYLLAGGAFFYWHFH